MTIKKIISGGQTGADQAALDVAIELGIPHGGWVPKGRNTENGPLPEKYQMQEMPTASYEKRTEQNVIDSHGTLIISHGKLTGGSAKTLQLAKKHKRPCLHLDLTKTSAFIAAAKINNWIYQNAIEILNVAGPRASKDPSIYQATLKLLKAVFFMDSIDEEEIPDPDKISHYEPQTVEEAVKSLTLGLSLKNKSIIANMQEYQLPSLHNNIGQYIRDKFGLSSGNDNLMESCRFVSKKYGIHYQLYEDDAPAIIIRELWRELQGTHTLRVIK